MNRFIEISGKRHVEYGRGYPYRLASSYALTNAWTEHPKLNRAVADPGRIDGPGGWISDHRLIGFK